jgi:hypothetical protein
MPRQEALSASMTRTNGRNVMRSIFLIAGIALALSACGNGGEEANTLVVNDMTINDGTTDNSMLNGDMNAMTVGNEIMDANTQNAVEQDLTTNDADTNLANGM